MTGPRSPDSGRPGGTPGAARHPHPRPRRHPPRHRSPDPARIERRRRGHDFFANYERALQAARDLAVHAVVHAGDVFYRSRVPASLVHADSPRSSGSRTTASRSTSSPATTSARPSRSPAGRAPAHPRLRPAADVQRGVEGARVGLAGFPFQRTGVREAFRRLLADTDWEAAGAEVNLLCLISAWRAPPWTGQLHVPVRGRRRTRRGPPDGVRRGAGRPHPPPPGAHHGPPGPPPGRSRDLPRLDRANLVRRNRREQGYVVLEVGPRPTAGARCGRGPSTRSPPDPW